MIGDGPRWSIVAAAIAGAAVGSKLLYWLEDPALTLRHANDLVFLMAGKTVVGGLVGGLIAVEATKKFIIGPRESTGDLFAVPLALGIAIGRIGCFLAGLFWNTTGWRRCGRRFPPRGRASRRLQPTLRTLSAVLEDFTFRGL